MSLLTANAQIALGGAGANEVSGVLTGPMPSEGVVNYRPEEVIRSWRRVLKSVRESKSSRVVCILQRQ